MGIQYNRNIHKEFQHDLQKTVSEYFKSQDLTMKATKAMYFRVVFFFSLIFTGLYLLYSSAFMTTLNWISAFLLLLFGLKGLAYNVVHDACHEAISGNEKIDNILFFISMTILGPDPVLWKRKHNIDHHNYVNIPEYDSQIKGAWPILRLSPHQQWLKHHRYQHLYVTFVYAIVNLHWIFVRDFKEILTTINPLSKKIIALLRALTLKSFYCFLWIGLPALNLGLLSALVFFLCFQLISSYFVTITFAVSHLNEAMVITKPSKSGLIDHSHFEHQAITSTDYSPCNFWINFLFAGMAAHVAHHLFPSISSIHLKKLTPLLEKVFKKHHINYYEHSYFYLIRSHYRYLKALGASKDSGQEYLVQFEGT